MAIEICNEQSAETTDAVAVTIVAALKAWGGWALDIPPTGSTGDEKCDKQLASAFRALAAFTDRDQRLRWIESVVFSTDDFVPPGAPADPYRETLMRWWLDLFNSEQSGASLV